MCFSLIVLFFTKIEAKVPLEQIWTGMFWNFWCNFELSAVWNYEKFCKIWIWHTTRGRYHDHFCLQHAKPLLTCPLFWPEGNRFETKFFFTLLYCVGLLYSDKPSSEVFGIRNILSISDLNSTHISWTWTWKFILINFIYRFLRETAKEWTGVRWWGVWGGRRPP